MPRTLLLLAPILLILAGCGGDGPSDDFASGCGIQSDPAYAGTYAATFAPASAGPRREFRLTVDLNGRISGTARDPESGGPSEVPVTGQTLNSPAPCGSGLTTIELSYTLPGSPRESVRARREIAPSIAVSFEADRATSPGTLTLRRY